jgi:hypothetical protein
MKVYIINKGIHDFSCAERFGDLVFLSEGPVSKYATGVMMREFRVKMQNSTKDDHILITSLTIMSVIACVIFALKHRCLNLLIHKDNNYQERRLDLTDI